MLEGEWAFGLRYRCIIRFNFINSMMSDAFSFLYHAPIPITILASSNQICFLLPIFWNELWPHLLFTDGFRLMFDSSFHAIGGCIYLCFRHFSIPSLLFLGWVLSYLSPVSLGHHSDIKLSMAYTRKFRLKSMTSLDCTSLERLKLSFWLCSWGGFEFPNFSKLAAFRRSRVFSES